MPWGAAKAYCLELELDGNGWRLPSVDELRALVRGCPDTELDGACSVSEGNCTEPGCESSSCDGCPPDEGPSDGCYWPTEVAGECLAYWSSTADSTSVDFAWAIDFHDANVRTWYGALKLRVRCVRDPSVDRQD